VTTVITKDPWPPPKPDFAPPIPDDFTSVFLGMERQRMQLENRNQSGRLYLYFSGHGFCNRDSNRDAEAALYTANASKDQFAHIYGTFFARRAKAKALFKEVVLIMDCCRDSEITRMPIPPMLADTPDDRWRKMYSC